MSWPIPWRIGLPTLVLFLTSNLAAAFEAAVRAPVGCTKGASCGFDIDLHDARASAERFSAACRSAQAKKEECDLPAATTSHICDEPVRYYYTWAYLKDVVGGNEALADLERAASSGEPFGWSMVVQASGTPADEKHLALCSISHVQGIAGGPPLACVTVAIITPEMTLLRGGRDRDLCFKSGSSRIDSGTIDINYEVQTRLEIEKFSDSIQRMLINDLGLTVSSD